LNKSRKEQAQETWKKGERGDADKVNPVDSAKISNEKKSAKRRSSFLKGKGS